MSTPSDLDLFPGLRQRAEPEVGALLGRYWERAYRVALQLVQEPAAAEDVAQQTFVAVLEGAHRIEDPSRFRSWFFSVLHNQARKSLRADRRRVARERRASHSEVTHGPDPAEAELEQLVRAELGALPLPCRAAVALRYLEGMSLAEVAEALDCPLGTVSSRVRRGLETLRGRLGERVPASTGALVPFLRSALSAPAPAIPTAAGLATAGASPAVLPAVLIALVVALTALGLLRTRAVAPSTPVARVHPGSPPPSSPPTPPALAPPQPVKAQPEPRAQPLPPTAPPQPTPAAPPQPTPEVADASRPAPPQGAPPPALAEAGPDEVVLCGRVTLDGVLVGGVEVTWFNVLHGNHDAFLTGGASTVSDAHGRFRFSLGPGDLDSSTRRQHVVLRARRERGAQVWVAAREGYVRRDPGKTWTFGDLELTSLERVELVVEAQGIPVEGAEVKFFYAPPPPSGGVFPPSPVPVAYGEGLRRPGTKVSLPTTDRFGVVRRFEAFPGDEREVCFRVSAPGYTTHFGRARCSAREVTRVELSRGVGCGGRVTDVAGKPIGGAKLYLSDMLQVSGGSRAELPVVESDDAGEFVLDGLRAEGEYRVQVQPPHGSDFRGQRLFLSGAERSPLSVVLERGARVRVEVTANAEPSRRVLRDLLDAKLFQRTPDGNWESVDGYESSFEGDHQLLTRVPVGVDLRVQRGLDFEFQPAVSAPFRASLEHVQRVELERRPGRFLMVNLRDSTGRSVTATVRFRSPIDPCFDIEREFEGTTLLPGLPRGPLQLEFERPGHDPLRVDVSAGEVELELQLDD